MYEKAHEALLSRAEARKHVTEHLKDEISYLTELVNYGTNLIIRVLGPHPSDVAKQVVCGALLKHVVGMLDACVVLLESGHSTAAYPQARSAFEASIFIEFILQEQSKLRAQTYLVGEYRRRREFAMSILDTSNDPGSFNEKFGPIGMDTNKLEPQVVAVAERQLAELNEALNTPPLDRIDQLYQTRRKNKKHDPVWYACLGFGSIFQLAKELNQIPAYDLWYAQGSTVMHAGSFAQQVTVFEGRGTLKAIRNLENSDAICSAVGNIALRTYRIIIGYYRPLELPALRTKYLEDWQKMFHSSKKINYNFD